jgi:hypothetical protein
VREGAERGRWEGIDRMSGDQRLLCVIKITVNTRNVQEGIVLGHDKETESGFGGDVKHYISVQGAWNGIL